MLAVGYQIKKRRKKGHGLKYFQISAVSALVFHEYSDEDGSAGDKNYDGILQLMQRKSENGHPAAPKSMWRERFFMKHQFKGLVLVTSSKQGKPLVRQASLVRNFPGRRRGEPAVNKCGRWHQSISASLRK